MWGAENFTIKRGPAQASLERIFGHALDFIVFSGPHPEMRNGSAVRTHHPGESLRFIPGGSDPSTLIGAGERKNHSFNAKLRARAGLLVGLSTGAVKLLHILDRHRSPGRVAHAAQGQRSGCERGGQLRQVVVL